ncbi:hypothetical protein MMC22_008735 [Lobaria immixta]|nr:hypothetical protein [Lobaria immixta]
MRLLDLPPEILRTIAEKIVITLGPFKAQEVRLVNRFLSCEILQATFTTRIIDSYPSDNFERMSTSLKARHLETRTLTDPRGVNEFTTVIQNTVNHLLRGMREQSDDLRLEYTHILCAAAADYLDSTQAVDGAADTRISCAAVDAIHTSIFSKAVIDDSARCTLVLNKLKTISLSNEYANQDVRDLFAAAAHVGNALLLKNLLDKGVKIDAETVRSPHITALQAAALIGHEHIVRLLLEPKYRVELFGYEYERAMLFAARGGHLALVQFLMENGKIREWRMLQVQHWVLLEASRYGHEPIVKMMLDLGTKPNDRYSGGESPLRVAASHNFHKIVQLLLASGADPDKGGVDERWTPLYDAVRGGHERVAQMLLDHGADINAGWYTPLHIAVKRGNLHMGCFLLERGAKLDIGWHTSFDILATAADRGHEPMVRLLVKFGASVDDSDKKPFRAMLAATSAGHDHVVQTLIELVAKKIDPL